MTNLPEWLDKPVQAKVIDALEARQLLERSQSIESRQRMAPPALWEQIAAARLHLWTLEQQTAKGL